jgi:hypothetical protein
MNRTIHSLSNLKTLSLSLVAALFCFGCGSVSLPVVDPVSTACPTGVAQILIGDGFLKPTCGCIGAGESDRVYAAQERLTCHLETSTTQVFFYLWGAQLPHQIISTGGESFISSPVMDSKKAPPQFLSFTVFFPTPATTYDFKEVYTGMVGNFVVP